jgi:glycosyltransferase involved in cell wall biosynthesis
MIPTYNQQDYLVQAVKSVLAQSYTNMEVIISDDASTDRTPDLIHDIHDSRVVYSRNQKNLGRTENYRHTLYNLVKGDWAINLDGDDYFCDNDFVSKAMKEVVNNENIVLVQASRYSIDEKGRKDSAILRIPKNPFSLSGRDYFINRERLGLFSHGATIYQSKLARKLNFYSHDSLSTDYFSVMKLALQGDVLLMRDPVLVWRIHQQNDSASKTLETLEKDFLYLEDLADEASKYITDREAQRWLSAEKKKRARHLIYTAIQTGKPKSQVMKMISEKGELSYFYFKQLIKLYLSGNSRS